MYCKEFINWPLSALFSGLSVDMFKQNRFPYPLVLFCDLVAYGCKGGQVRGGVMTSRDSGCEVHRTIQALD